MVVIKIHGLVMNKQYIDTSLYNLIIIIGIICVLIFCYNYFFLQNRTV